MSFRARPPTATAAATAALLAAAIGGCGGGSAGNSRGGIEHATVSGRVVFAQHCAVCHSISGRLSRGQQGGDLRGLHLPRNELVQFTVEMPVIRRPLHSREVQAVVDYMQALARRR